MNLNVELTKTEYEVGELLAKGDQTKEVADKLYKSTHTIIEHRKRLFQKTEVTSIGQFCFWWFHKYYDLTPKVFASAVVMFILAFANEINTEDDFARVRTSNAKVRTGGKRRKSEDENTISI